MTSVVGFSHRSKQTNKTRMGKPSRRSQNLYLRSKSNMEALQRIATEASNMAFEAYQKKQLVLLNPFGQNYKEASQRGASSVNKSRNRACISKSRKCSMTFQQVQEIPDAAIDNDPEKSANEVVVEQPQQTVMPVDSDLRIPELRQSKLVKDMMVCQVESSPKYQRTASRESRKPTNRADRMSSSTFTNFKPSLNSRFDEIISPKSTTEKSQGRRPSTTKPRPQTSDPTRLGVPGDRRRLHTDPNQVPLKTQQDILGEEYLVDIYTAKQEQSRIKQKIQRKFLEKYPSHYQRPPDPVESDVREMLNRLIRKKNRRYNRFAVNIPFLQGQASKALNQNLMDSGEFQKSLIQVGAVKTTKSKSSRMASGKDRTALHFADEADDLNPKVNYASMKNEDGGFYSRSKRKCLAEKPSTEMGSRQLSSQKKSSVLKIKDRCLIKQARSKTDHDISYIKWVGNDKARKLFRQATRSAYEQGLSISNSYLRQHKKQERGNPSSFQHKQKHMRCINLIKWKEEIMANIARPGSRQYANLKTCVDQIIQEVHA